MSPFNLIDIKEVDVGLRVRAESSAYGLTFTDVQELLAVLDAKPGTWYEIERHGNPGTGNPAHKRRERVNKLLKANEITGYQFTVREGCILYGQKLPEDLQEEE
jgi:hypothetical protein